MITFCFILDLDSEEVKRNKKESKSPIADVHQIDPDFCDDMKIKPVSVIKQDPSNQVSLYILLILHFLLEELIDDF